MIFKRTVSTASTVDSRNKSRSAPLEKKKSKGIDSKKSKRISVGSMRHSDTASLEPSVLKYVLDFGKYVHYTEYQKNVILLTYLRNVFLHLSFLFKVAVSYAQFKEGRLLWSITQIRCINSPGTK